MKNVLTFLEFFLSFHSCSKQESKECQEMEHLPSVQEMISEFAPVQISTDLSFLSERERK